MVIQAKLEKEGFKFLKKTWPIIPVQKLKDLGITPEMLGNEYHQATLYQVMGPHWCYEIKLETSAGKWRVLALRAEKRK